MVLVIGYLVGWILVRESCSALSASSLENLAAVGSLHSLSETMLFLSLTLFRLVSKHSLHLLASADIEIRADCYITKYIIHAKASSCQEVFAFSFKKICIF